MSGTLDRLVPVLDGVNWRESEVCMTAYLQMQELWEVASTDAQPVEPQATVRTMPATETTAERRVRVPPSDEEVAAHAVLLATWRKQNMQVLGAITLCLAPQLRHHLEHSACVTWEMLKQQFGERTVSAYYSDFKAIMSSKLSGGNPIPEMERLATLFGRLDDTPIDLPDTLQAMILLAALPPKWDSWSGSGLGPVFFQS
jgi:hypothetical protein